MHDRYVFNRTDRGAAEINDRSSLLSPKHRRCLILADGNATVRDLATSFRPGELGPLLRELVERGLLEAPPGGIDVIEASAAKITFIDDARFLEVQQGAMQEIMRRLGAAGEPIARQISACARPEQLRIALRSLEKALAGSMSAEEAKEFVKRVGQELMGA